MHLGTEQGSSQIRSLSASWRLGRCAPAIAKTSERRSEYPRLHHILICMALLDIIVSSTMHNSVTLTADLDIAAVIRLELI